MATVLKKLKKAITPKLGRLSSSSTATSHSGTAFSDFSATSSGFSREIDSEFSKCCAICLSNVKGGQGQAIFTAECSHSFHYPCIANNVQHGNLSCPICRAKWDKNNVTFLVPPLQQNNLGAHGFTDDTLPAAQFYGPKIITIKTYTETSAIPAADSRPEYTVLVSICAPLLQDPEGEGRTRVAGFGVLLGDLRSGTHELNRGAFASQIAQPSEPNQTHAVTTHAGETPRCPAPTSSLRSLFEFVESVI